MPLEGYVYFSFLINWSSCPLVAYRHANLQSLAFLSLPPPLTCSSFPQGALGNPILLPLFSCQMPCGLLNLSL